MNGRKLSQATRLVKVAALILFLSHCKGESQPDSVEKPTVKEEPGETTSDSKTFKIASMKVSASAEVFKTDGLMTDKEVEKCLRDKLEASNAFDDTSDRAAKVHVTYDYHAADERTATSMFATVQEPSVEGVRIEIGTRLTGTDPLAQGKTNKEIATIVCERLSDKIIIQTNIALGDDETILAMLKSEEIDGDGLLAAVQEARERQLKASVPELKKQLVNSDTRVAVAAAASLALLDREDSRADVLKLAETLSRERDRQYVPMLHILASFGGPEVEEYLKTVAESHSADAVREVAKQALEGMKK